MLSPRTMQPKGYRVGPNFCTFTTLTGASSGSSSGIAHGRAVFISRIFSAPRLASAERLHAATTAGTALTPGSDV